MGGQPTNYFAAVDTPQTDELIETMATQYKDALNKKLRFEGLQAVPKCTFIVKVSFDSVDASYTGTVEDAVADAWGDVTAAYNLGPVVYTGEW